MRSAKPTQSAAPAGGTAMDRAAARRFNALSAGGSLGHYVVHCIHPWHLGEPFADVSFVDKADLATS